jgi:outer membrane protein assembly factor BamB
MVEKGKPGAGKGNRVALGSGGPDVYGYVWKDSDAPDGPAYEWFDIFTVGTNSGLMGDNVSTTLSIPFNFSFYSNNYDQVTVSSNGYLTFKSFGNYPGNVAIPHWAIPNNMIAPFMDDLHSGTGALTYYHDSGTSRFIIQYSNWGIYKGTASFTFQVQLHENGTILFYYNTMSGTLNSATVGIENKDGTDGLQIAYNQNYVHDHMAVRIEKTTGTPEITVQRHGGLPVADGGTDDAGPFFAGEIMLAYDVLNTGVAQLRFDSVTVSNWVNVSAVAVEASLPVYVPPGDTAAFLIWMIVDSAGPFSLDVDIASNDADENPYSITITGAASVPPPLADTPWPMFQHDLRHTGRSIYQGPAQIPSLKWQFQLEGRPGSPVIGADGTIYLPTGLLNSKTPGYLYAINPDGTQKWRFRFAGYPSHTAPAVSADGTIYVHMNGNNGNIIATEKLYALNSDGTLKWIYIFNNGLGVYCADVISSPAIGNDGTIYVGSMDSRLYAVNPNGVEKWRQTVTGSINTSCSIHSSPVIAPDGTLFIQDSFCLGAISPQGILLWHTKCGESTAGSKNSPSMADDGTLYLGESDSLLAMNPDGTLKWGYRIPDLWDIYTTAAIGSDGTIYEGTEKGLFAIRPDGTMKWIFNPPVFGDNCISPVIGSDGTVYWMTYYSMLGGGWFFVAIRPDGTERWRIPVSTPEIFANRTACVIGSDGTLFVPTSDWLNDSNQYLKAYYSPPPEVIDYVFPKSGWYMVSLPVIPPDSLVSTIFPTALGGKAFGWDPAGGAYLPETKMKREKGYWLAIPGATAVTVSGQALNSYTQHFGAQGWNMIGSVLGDADFSNPNDNPDGRVLSPAFGWDTAAEAYIPVTTLNEKEGYWAAVFGECDLTVGGAGGESSAPLAKADWETFYERFGKIPPGPPTMEGKTGKLVEIPKEFGMSQNYPNPFNPETKIRYQIVDAGFVRLVVYNTMGRVVKKLVDEQQNAGYYEVVWDGKDENGLSLGSGMYLVRMEAEDFTSIRKALLMK